MSAYFLRRILYAVPLLAGVNILTFVLFFVINSPEDMARMHLGQKHVTQEAIAKWKHDLGYDLPLFWNEAASGLDRVGKTIFFEKSLKLMAFEFGPSDAGRDIGADIIERLGPSLALSVPSLVVGLLVNITLALGVVFVRASRLEFVALVTCVVLMSISPLFYIIGGQFLMARLMQMVPISGWVDGFDSVRFLVLPVLVSVVAGLGSGVRWYRTLFLEEVERDYVRTARAKGLSEAAVLFRHVLPNALVPILTGVVVVIPLLFMGSLLMESFFAIPGLGSYTIDAINRQDFAIVRAMVYLGSVLYIAGLLLTDLAYTLVDPRVRLS